MDLYLGIAVVLATLLGPVLAVFVTRYVDRQRERTNRQYENFRALMRSRRSALSPEYVSALNTVEIEFAGVKPIEEALKNLFQHLSAPQTPDWTDRLRRLQARLLYTIAKHLRFEVEQLDVLEGGYFPMAWGASEEQINEIRANALEVLRGNRPLKISQAGFQAPGSDVGALIPKPGETFAFKGAKVGEFLNFGILQLTEATIAGSDLLGASYSGHYKIENSRFKCTGEVTVLKPIVFPDGASVPAGTVQAFVLDWPIPIPQGQPLPLKLGEVERTVSVYRLQ